MGAAKTIGQGNPPQDDAMRKYMTYQQERAAGQGNPAENLSRKVGAFNRGESPEMRNRPPADRTLSDYRPPADRTLSDYRAGINLGPGRANRTPEQGSREYEQLLQQIRSRNKGRR
jgi:hypothetical protein